MSILKFDAATAVKQDFPYPSLIMYYIKHSQKGVLKYFKLIKSCKYFYSPADPIPYCFGTDLTHGPKTYCMYLFNRHYNVSLNDLRKIDKIWLIGQLYVNPDTLPLPFYSSLLKKLYLCDIYFLWIHKQTISFNDFKVLTSSKVLHTLCFGDKASVWYEENDSVVPFDEIIKFVPNLKRFDYDSPHASTPECLKKIVEILNPVILQRFGLTRIFESFDLDTFLAFMRKNPHVHYILDFANEYILQKEYIEKLQNFVDEIIKAGETKYPPPEISFAGLSQEDQKSLKALRRKYTRRFTPNRFQREMEIM